MEGPRLTYGREGERRRKERYGKRNGNGKQGPWEKMDEMERLKLIRTKKKRGRGRDKRNSRRKEGDVGKNGREKCGVDSWRG